MVYLRDASFIWRCILHKHLGIWGGVGAAAGPGAPTVFSRQHLEATRAVVLLVLRKICIRGEDLHLVLVRCFVAVTIEVAMAIIAVVGVAVPHAAPTAATIPEVKPVAVVITAWIEAMNQQ